MSQYIWKIGTTQNVAIRVHYFSNTQYMVTTILRDLIKAVVESVTC